MRLPCSNVSGNDARIVRRTKLPLYMIRVGQSKPFYTVLAIPLATDWSGSDEALFEAVIGGFLGDDDIVGMALLEAGMRHSGEAPVEAELADRAGTGDPHPGS